MSVESNFAFALVFGFTSLCDWLAQEQTRAEFAPFSQPVGSQTQTNRVAFYRPWRRLHVFASNSDWFIVRFTSVLIGQGNYFGFGFAIGHFRVGVNLIMKARLSAKLFMLKLVLFAYE